MNAVTQGQQAMPSDPSALDAFETALARLLNHRTVRT